MKASEKIVYTHDDQVGTIVEDRNTFSHPYKVKCEDGHIKMYEAGELALFHSTDTSRAAFEADELVVFKINSDDVDWADECPLADDTLLGKNTKMFFRKGDEVRILDIVDSSTGDMKCFWAQDHAGLAPISAITTKKSWDILQEKERVERLQQAAAKGEL